MASGSAVINTAPTLRIDGQDNDMARSLLLGMEVTEQVGGMSALELRFSNINSRDDGSADFAFEDGAILKLGTEIKVYGGDTLSPQHIFVGKVTALEASFPDNSAPELRVLAEDGLQGARMKRRTAVYDNATLANIVQQVAGNLSLQPQVDGLTDNIGTQVQYNETDLGFLRRLLSRYDADMQVVGTQLQASARSQVQRNQIELRLNFELRSLRVIADLAHQTTEVNLSGWDVKQGQAVQVSSQAGPTAPADGTPGSQILQNVFGERKEHLGHLAVADSSEAQAVADAAFDSRARRFVVAHGVTEGNPSLRVGTFLKLSGLGPRFSNTYYVTHARHRYNTEVGYQTEFEAECAALGGSN
ncbi:MAG TPA: contractile injection system protein, VgrG/Pvc8 family [Terriglobales bacterium]